MDERSVHTEFRSTMAIPRRAGILPGKSGNGRSDGSCSESRFSSDDRRIYLPSTNGGHPAVVYEGVSVFGDQRRVQLSGYDAADDASATLPIIAKHFRPAAPWNLCGAVFLVLGCLFADAKV